MAPSDRKKVLLKQSCSLDYEDTADSVKSMEATSVKNKGSMEALVVKNKSNNLVERACSEDRGLRRRPKVILIQSMRDYFFSSPPFKRGQQTTGKFGLASFVSRSSKSPQKETPAWLSWSREQLGETPRFLIGTGTHRSR